ncbi:MAG: FkbM family methyltransferase [Egibacteraceae bacterium]
MSDDSLSVGSGPLAWLVRRAWFLEDELLLLPRLAPRGGICVDAGAANGVYTVALARLVGPTGIVHAVEPQPFAYRNLRAIRRLLRLRNVSLHPIALADRQGRTRMLVPRRLLRVHGRAYLWDEAGEPTIYPDEFRGVDGLSVPMTTLDALVSEWELPALHLIKCDVEGAELRLLKGAHDTIARYRPALLIEVEERHTAKYGHHAREVFAWLADRGYSATALRGGRPYAVSDLVPGIRNYLWRPDFR